MKKSIVDISILKKYIFSYLSIALIACITVGISLFFLSTRQLQQAALQSEQKKLSIAANDLENQHKIMRDISYKISVDIAYKTFYIQNIVSRQKELISDLGKYKDYSPIVDDYFFYRKDGSLIYKTSAANSLDIYIAKILLTDEADEITDLLNNAENFTVYDIDGSRFLFLYPIRVDNTRPLGSDAVVGFIVSKKSILSRINDITSGVDSSVYIYYQEIPIVSNGIFNVSELTFLDDGILDEHGETIGARSEKGEFIILTDFSLSSTQERLSAFRNISIVIIVITVVLVAMLGYIAAKSNYRPIEELVLKYHINGDVPESKNAIKNIDHALQTAIDRNQMYQFKMKEQYSIMENQKKMVVENLFLLVLNGEYDEKIQMGLQSTGITFLGSNYCVFVVRLHEKADDNEKLELMIDSLSDESIFLYCVNLRYENSFAVIVNADEQYLISDAKNKIKKLCFDMGIDSQISQGKICSNLKSLPISLSSAFLSERAKPGTAAEMKEGSWYDNTDVFLMLSLIKKNDLEGALEKLDIFTQNLKKDESSVLQQHYIFADVLVTIMRISYEFNNTIIKEKAGKVLLSNTIEEFHDGTAELLSELYMLIHENERAKLDQENNRIIEYIREHATDYDLNYDKLYSEFQLPVKTIRAIIKEKTRKSLREYLIVLRITHAQKLLSDNPDITVAETANKVGFSSVSYFIKQFRSITAVTPANFVKNNAKK